MRFNIEDLTAKDIIEVERYSGIPVTNWNLEAPSMGMMVGIIYVMLRREKPKLQLATVEGWNITQLNEQADRLFPTDDDEPDAEPNEAAPGNAEAPAALVDTAPSTANVSTSFPSSSNDFLVSPQPTTGTSRPTNVSLYDLASKRG